MEPCNKINSKRLFIIKNFFLIFFLIFFFLVSKIRRCYLNNIIIHKKNYLEHYYDFFDQQIKLTAKLLDFIYRAPLQIVYKFNFRFEINYSYIRIITFLLLKFTHLLRFSNLHWTKFLIVVT